MSVLIYSFPVLVDIVVSFILFACSVKVSELTDQPLVISLIISVWSITYFIFSYLCGKVVTQKNVVSILVCSCLIMSLVCLGLSQWVSIPMLYFFVCIGGIGASAFFTAFQVFMDMVDQQNEKHISYSTSLYTFSWSLGFSIGPLLSGFLIHQVVGGWRVACYGGIGLCFMCIGLLFYVLKAMKRGSRRVVIEDGLKRYEGKLKLIELSWLGGVVGILAFWLIRSLLPEKCNELGIHIEKQGVLFFLMSFVQALTALSLYKSREWMFELKNFIRVNLIGLIGALCFVFGNTFEVYVLGSVLCGVYGGFFYFLFVFHALVDASKVSKYVGVNESLVGLAGIVGPAICGSIAYFGEFSVASLFGAGLILLCIVIQKKWYAKASVL